METLRTAVIHSVENDRYKKPVKEETCHVSESETEESNYVDLNCPMDMKTDGTKTVKVTFTGEGNQLAIYKCQGDTPTPSDGGTGKRKENSNLRETPSKDCHQDHSKDGSVGQRNKLNSSSILDDEISNTDMPSTETDPHTELILQDYKPQNVSCESEELRYTDMYLNSQSESDDGSSSVVLSDQSTVNTFADESHYITTHEIQLTELDHDVDYEIGRGPCWDYEDDNLVYSFVDYASFESDETTEGTLILDGRIGKAKITKAHSVKAGQYGVGGTAVSTESDVCDSDKCVSSDESVCKNFNGGESSSERKIHLSIQTSSRPFSNSNNVIGGEKFCYRARRTGERSQYFFKGSGPRREAFFDQTRYFIPAPGRQHLAPQLKGKDINEFSSGASSSVSELDDADKEVRNLTAKSFRSLACPYFDAINLSTSSESSLSEHGIGFNKWSALMDLNYGNIAQRRDNRLISQKSSTFEVKKNVDPRNRHSASNSKVPHTKTCSHKNKNVLSHVQNASATKKLEVLGQCGNTSQGETITLTETLDVSCNVEAGLPVRKRGAKCVDNTLGSRSTEEVTGVMPSRPGSEAANPHSDCGDSMDETHKKAIFASSLLKNVISKKMQFEQERKMERGEIRDAHNGQSPCHLSKDCDIYQSKPFETQSSESDSERAALTEVGDTVDTSKSGWRDHQDLCAMVSLTEPTQDSPDDAVKKTYQDVCENKIASLAQSQNSAFKSWKDGESGNAREKTTEKTSVIAEVSGDVECQSVSGKSTKMSHLYVPSSQLLLKDREARQQAESKNKNKQGEKENEGEVNNRTDASISQAKKAPEIKIRLRSVKDNKNHPFNIANLLTPNIGYSSIHPFKALSDSKCQMLSSSDKVPHFTVRDIRESKGKFQTPIHQVRDVRKLVKSSYRFVSLENTEQKPCSSGPLSKEDKVGVFKKEPDKRHSQSPMIIKFHSVNTNSASKQCCNAADASQRTQIENISDVERLSPKQLCDGVKNDSVFAGRCLGRAPCLKSAHSDQTEHKIDTKVAKSRPDKGPETLEKKVESKATNQAALEKLKAAVKTMEQLYVFDRNEWKRKTQAPQPVTDSHVLSLITSEEQSGLVKSESEEERNKHTSNEWPASSIVNPPTMASTQHAGVALVNDSVNSKSVTVNQNDKSISKTSSVHAERFNNKCVFNFGSGMKALANCESGINVVRQGISSQEGVTTSKTVPPKFQRTPLSLKITAPKRDIVEKAVQKGIEISHQSPPGKPVPADAENYLTIPVKACTTDTQTTLHSTAASVNQGTSRISCQPTTSSQHPQQQPLQRSPIIMESWAPDSPPTATIYHHSLPVPMAATAAAGPQVLCLSPTLMPAMADHIQQQQQQQTQKKMLLDPTTGHFYLVDTPVQPPTKRLFDPETGQYVEVPVSPPQPLTPVPMPISPLALSPAAAFAPTYMIYPSLMASPPAFTTHSVSSSTHSDGDNDRLQSRDTDTRLGPGASHSTQSSPQLAQSVAGALGGASVKPVISITGQQGPRIIAPPSFDGTTMSFVVEHR